MKKLFKLDLKDTHTHSLTHSVVEERMQTKNTTADTNESLHWPLYFNFIDLREVKTGGRATPSAADLHMHRVVKS